jgi:hypothetical protein
MKQKFYSQVNMERIFFFSAGGLRDGSAPAKEDGVRLRIIGAGRIGKVHGGEVALGCESAPGAA